ncbi:MAG: FRG domain-containing protein [Bacteroidota bacterium]
MEISFDEKFYDWRNSKWVKGELRYETSKMINEWIKHSIEERYTPIAEVIFHNSWTDYAKLFKEYQKNNNIIFRGQSNAGRTSNFDFWQIVSNLNRHYPDISLKDFFSFTSQGKQQLREYPAFSQKISTPDDIHLIDLLAFLQHRGISTPLVDFSYDPITALFFACAAMPFETANGSDYRFLSIFEIDSEVLFSYGIREMPGDFSFNQYDFQCLDPYNPMPDHFVGSDKPCMAVCRNLPGGLQNFNLTQQDGAFLLIHVPKMISILSDRQRCLRYNSLEDLLLHIRLEKNIHVKPLKLHLIPYQSIFLSPDDDKIFSMPDTLYLYLEIKQKTGKLLFAGDDLNAFKYDFMFNSNRIHQRAYYLSKLDNSPEKEFLLQMGVI